MVDGGSMEDGCMAPLDQAQHGLEHQEDNSFTVVSTEVAFAIIVLSTKIHSLNNAVDVVLIKFQMLQEQDVKLNLNAVQIRLEIVAEFAVSAQVE